MDVTELDRLYESINNWGRWGDDDQRGTLNYISPETIVGAASEVKEGHVVGTGYINLTNRLPSGGPGHGMVRTGEDHKGGGSFVSDYFGLAFHGPGTTHIDALSHGLHNGYMYNGRPASMVTHEGSQANAITALGDGVVTRGVLADLPRLRGQKYLSPDEPVYPSELDEALESQGVQAKEGDALVLYAGRDARLRDLGPGAEGADGLGPLAGLHVSCLSWLHENRTSILATDGGSDVLPSGLDHMLLPVHIGALVHLGLHLIDNVALDKLASACRERKRWTFMYSVSPLRIEGGTGSPVNPIAIF